MRDDYFTLEEFAGVVNVHHSVVKRIFNKYPDFPVTRVGKKYIIPKLHFFRWYYRHKDGDALRCRFDARLIEKAHCEYIRQRVQRKVM